MGKSVLLNCDVCGTPDTTEAKVQTIGVAGVRFEICRADRIKMLVAMGIDEGKAEKFVDAYDLRATRRGGPTVLKDRAGAQVAAAAPEDDAEADPDQDPLPLADEDAEAETGDRPAETPRGRRKS